MPGMDGIDSMSQIRSYERELRTANPALSKVDIYMVSAYEEQHLQDRLSALDIQGYLKKPVCLPLLKDLVKNVFKGRPRVL